MKTDGGRRLQLIRTSSGGKHLFLVFDLFDEIDVRQITDYSIELSVRLGLSPPTVSKRVEHIIEFWEYLVAKGMRLQALCSSDLVEFRNAAQAKILEQPAARGSEVTAKQTANGKLSSVEDWLGWLERNGQVRLCLDEFIDTKFRKVGTASRHKHAAFLDDETLDALRVSLEESEDPYVVQRNLLLIDIANAVGLRRASINSLTTDQFDLGKLSTMSGGYFLVRPMRQKFGYENEFEFPVWLGLRICEFIDGPRRELLSNSGRAARRHRNHLFLSSRTGLPLTDNAISRLIGKQMKILGASKGSAIHALRTKFANDEIDKELDMRILRGMDTSTASIALAVAMKLGHRHPDSIYAYVSSRQSRKVEQARADENA